MPSGHRLVEQAVRERGSYRQAAIGIPAHFAHLNKIALGEREPELALAVVLEREWGIPVEAWPSLREPVEELLRLRGAA